MLCHFFRFVVSAMQSIVIGPIRGTWRYDRARLLSSASRSLTAGIGGGPSLVEYSPQGKREFDAKVAEFKAQLEAECDRIESAENPGTPQEITPVHVRRAEHYLRYEPPRKKRSGKYYGAMVVSPAAGVLGGIAVNNYTTGWGAAGIALAIVIIFGAELYKGIKEAG